MKRKTSDDGLTDEEYLATVWPEPWQAISITVILGCLVGLLCVVI